MEFWSFTSVTNKTTLYVTIKVNVVKNKAFYLIIAQEMEGKEKKNKGMCCPGSKGSSGVVFG